MTNNKRRLPPHLQRSPLTVLVILLACCLLHWQSAYAQHTGSNSLEEKWGLYAHLVGTEKQEAGAYLLRWTWKQPEVELLEEWVDARKGKVTSKITITLGDRSGEFRLKGIGGKIWQGVQQADGSILYIGEGLLKMPYLVSLSSDGTYEFKDVVLNGRELASSKTRMAFAPMGGASIAAAADASTSTPETAAPLAAAEEPARPSDYAEKPIAPSTRHIEADARIERESVEQRYARLCSGDIRSEECDTLRNELIAKLSAVHQPAQQKAPSTTMDVAKWGFIGRDALNKAQLVITASMSQDKKFSSYVYGAMLLEYQWISDTELKKTTTQLEVTTYSGGYGAKGTPETLPSDSLSIFEETLRLNEDQAKIDVTQHFLAGLSKGLEHKYQLDVQPAENYGRTFKREFALNGQQAYAELTYSGDNREYLTGTIKNGEKHPDTYVRTFTVDGVPRSQIDAMIAGERQQFQATISQFHQKQPSSDGWLRALIGAGVGLAAAQAYGLDSTQTLGAVMKGVQITGDGKAATAAGALGDQLISGAASSQHSPGNSANTASYRVKDPVNMGEACSGFTESNYRTLAVNAPGDDAHLYAACGQAFELYNMYKNAVKQGYSETDADRTYQAHAGAAQNAIRYFQTRRAR